MSSVARRIGSSLSSLALLTLGLGALGTTLLVGTTTAGAITATPTTTIGCGSSDTATSTDDADLVAALQSPGTVDLTADCVYTVNTGISNADGSQSVLPSITGTTIVNGAAGTITTATSTDDDIFEVATTGNLTVNDVTLSGATVATSGIEVQGAATVDDSTVSGNTDAGLMVDPPTSGGTLTVEGSTISGNSGSNGGAISNEDTGTVTVDEGSTISGNTGSGAAAIDNDGTGTMTIDDSTISGNTGTDSGGIQNDATLTVDNSTIANNIGGGISDGGVANVDDSTISGNTDSNGGAGVVGFGVFTAPSDTITLAGDILATASGAPVGGECSDAVNSIIDAGYNVDDDGTCGLTLSDSVSDSTTIDGFLGTLGSHGGAAETIPLSAGTGSNANPAQSDIPATFTAPGQGSTACSQTDERGTTRVTPCDMGAYALNTPIAYTVTYADGTGTGTPPTDSTQ
jgi:hypothetical protein